jgi:hypothetical protein
MEQEEMARNIDGLFAYDTGATDSGIKDEHLRAKVINCMQNLSEDELRIFLSNYIRERFLSSSAIANGYGIEDVKAFIEWLDEYMERYRLVVGTQS